MASLLRAVADAPGTQARGALAIDQLVGGKYRVVRPIGQGGMGVVYLARDERLGRDVALKLGTTVSTAALARAEREAQALARLSHPNVVVVHEVGEVDGRLFVAMEHVAGGTARAWLAQRRRSAREIITLYAAAGDGLTAAHAAGLVHRDVKPDNILVGTDGRPRVADFGLARAVDVADEAGAIVGTPAYMAPEQRTGGEVDARADQFAFCAALREALGAAAPRHVEQALRRGLAPTPADRWSAMAPLLAELRRDPAARRRRLAIGATLVAATGAAVAVPLTLRDRGPAPCGDAVAALTSTWNPARADQLGRGFTAAGGGPLWRELAGRIDGYAATWTRARVAACRATRVDGSQSEAMLDRRMLCLDGARAQLGAVLDAFTDATPRTVEQAAGAMALLPDPAACDDVARLERQAPLPADPAARVAIERTLDEIARARAATIRADTRDPVAAGDALVASAQATGWPPLVAQASRLRARFLRAKDRAAALAGYEQAAHRALEAGDDETAAWALADLGWDHAVNREAEAAQPWLDLARALWLRLGKPPAVGARLREGDAMRALALGDAAGGLAITREMVELNRRAFGDESYAVGNGHFAMAKALVNFGHYPEAVAEAKLALAPIEAAAGPDHPLTARYLDLLAEAELFAGDLDDAVIHADRALAIVDRWYGAADPHLINALDYAGTTRVQRASVAAGDEAGARAAFERELAILQQVDRPAAVADLETNLGNLEAQFGHPAEAIPHGERALAAHTRLLGADNPVILPDYLLLGEATRGVGRLVESERYLRAAVRIVEAGLGPTNPAVIRPRLALAQTLVAGARAADALAALAPLTALTAAGDLSPSTVADIELASAAAHYATGARGHARGRALATSARDRYAALGADQATARADAERWLAAHP